MLVPFLLTKFPFNILDKTIYGNVVNIEIKTTLDNESSTRPCIELMYYKDTVFLTIEDISGKEVIKKVFEGKAGAFDGKMYKIGDKVFHLYGSRYTIIMPNQEDCRIQCSVCGKMNNIDEEKCQNCRHTLMKQIIVE
jgi:hypothetical protein